MRTRAQGIGGDGPNIGVAVGPQSPGAWPGSSKQLGRVRDPPLHFVTEFEFGFLSAWRVGWACPTVTVFTPFVSREAPGNGEVLRRV